MYTFKKEPKPTAKSSPNKKPIRKVDGQGNKGFSELIRERTLYSDDNLRRCIFS